MEKIKPDFAQDAIAETLLLTIALRAFDAKQKKPILGDTKSVELVGQIDYNFEQFAKGYNIITSFTLSGMHFFQLKGGEHAVEGDNDAGVKAEVCY